MKTISTLATAAAALVLAACGSTPPKDGAGAPIAIERATELRSSKAST